MSLEHAQGANPSCVSAFIVTLPVLRVLCCSIVAVVSGWLRSSLFEHVLSHWKLPVGTVYNKNVKMIVTILQDLSRSI